MTGIQYSTARTYLTNIVAIDRKFFGTSSDTEGEIKDALTPSVGLDWERDKDASLSLLVVISKNADAFKSRTIYLLVCLDGSLRIQQEHRYSSANNLR